MAPPHHLCLTLLGLLAPMPGAKPNEVLIPRVLSPDEGSTLRSLVEPTAAEREASLETMEKMRAGHEEVRDLLTAAFEDDSIELVQGGRRLVTDFARRRSYPLAAVLELSLDAEIAVHEGRFALAVALYQKVGSIAPPGPEREHACLEGGRLLRLGHRFADARALLRHLLETEAEGAPGANEPWASSEAVARHRAAVAISATYEDEGDVERALAWLDVATDRHPYGSGCRTCVLQVRDRLAKVRARLEARR